MPENTTKKVVGVEYDQPWAMLPGALEERVRNSAILAIEPERKGYVVEDRLAVIPVYGGLIKSGYAWGLSARYADIADAAASAAADPEVKALLFDIDSPGGTVAGLEGLTRFLSTIEKPIYAYTDSTMASAAYRIGAVAEMIGAAADAQIGSIGVITVHVDQSRMLEDVGLKVTFLTAGKYKAIGNPAEPLSDDGRNYIQKRLDGLYANFVKEVVQGRSVLSEESADFWADGQVFLAGDAKNVGLIDKAGVSLAEFKQIIKEKEFLMNLEEFQVKHPDLYQQVRAKAQEEAMAAMENIKTDAQKAGVDMTLMVVAAFCGTETEKQIGAIMATGVEAKTLKALADAGLLARATSEMIPRPEPKGPTREEILAAYQAAEKPTVESDGPPEKSGETEDPVRAFESAVQAKMKADGIGRGEAIMACRRESPDMYDRWNAAHQK